MFTLDLHALVTAAVGATVKTWSGHDRRDTVGASEVGDCMRKVVYNKHGATPDASYEQDYGATERGNVIEAWIIDRMQQQLKALREAGTTDIELLFATDEGQKTLVAGAQSATPDGLFVSKTGFMLPNGEQVTSLYNEIKSKDPRPFDRLTAAEPNHIDQCIQGMDLLRRRTPHKPEWAVITYVNASFLSQRKQFFVRFDEGHAEALRARAHSILNDYDLDTLPDAEGRMYFDSKPCEYCPYKSICEGKRVADIPADEKPVARGVADQIGTLAGDYKALGLEIEDLEADRKRIAEQINIELTKAGTRKVKADWGSVSVWSAHPPASYDMKKMREDGVDVDAYQRPAGEPSLRVGVFLKKN